MGGECAVSLVFSPLDNSVCRLQLTAYQPADDIASTGKLGLPQLNVIVVDINSALPS